MKFGQLIEYNMKNIFLEKSYTKCGGEIIPRRFSKSKLGVSLDEYSKVLYSLSLLYAKLKDSCNILKLSCRPLAFTSHKAFKKEKEIWN